MQKLNEALEHQIAEIGQRDLPDLRHGRMLEAQARECAPIAKGDFGVKEADGLTWA